MLKPRARGSTGPPPNVSRQQVLRDRILASAELAAAMLAAERLVIAFRPGTADADQIVSAPTGASRWDAVVNALLAALANRLGDAVAAGSVKRTRQAPGSTESIERVPLGAREIEAIVRSEETGDGHEIAASAFAAGTSIVRIAAVVPSSHSPDELEASLELIARTVFAELALVAASASLDFWRSHGARYGHQAAGAKQELGLARAAASVLDNAVAALRVASHNEVFERFGELVADGAAFDQWIVAIVDGGSLHVSASSSGQKQLDLAGRGSAIAESFKRRVVIARWRDRDLSVAENIRKFYEDGIFAGSYVCIPFATGAIALGSRDSLASAERAQEIVERLSPFVAASVMEREASRRSALVRQLALRMFAAVDEERARIARDLHDDQAQLIAAAKIALSGRREAGREILRRVEDELRRKTRELRPHTIDGALLVEAIKREFAVLKRARVKAKLVGSGAAAKISRPVQQLCFQVVREMLSNVIRHAHARLVLIRIERSETAARVSVSDDGCGIGADRSEGIGLAGVRERLELMGGRLTVESRPGRTTVVAEIPESV